MVYEQYEFIEEKRGENTKKLGFSFCKLSIKNTNSYLHRFHHEEKTNNK
jgi:L-ribulose-5-phosphate 3-epimerase UlaE